MKQIEENVVNSFKLAKSDIIKLQNRVIELSQSQERIMEFMDELKSSGVKLTNLVRESKTNSRPKTITRTIVKKVPVVRTKTVIKKVPVTRTKIVVKTVHAHAKKVFVSSKDSKKFHIESCPFAQNIKPKSKVRYHSKVKALNEGLKPCKCVK
jgi:hypothetical protein|tara:strand:- start:49 stop:507 length:459 start_codon:yes stop_codon:yes gene_type:complete